MYNVNTELLKLRSVTDELRFSLQGILPSFDEGRIDVFPGQLDPGVCICIAWGHSIWEIIPGCEAALNKLSLVVRAGFRKLRQRITKKFNLICKGVKTLVRFSAPRFLRL